MIAPFTRRTALAILAAALAPALGLPSAAEAKRKKKRKKRPPAPRPPFCVGKTDGTSCGGQNRCRQGVCYRPPECLPTMVSTQTGCIYDAQCCSGECYDGIHWCAPTPRGYACLGREDCDTGLECIGYHCT